MHAGYAIVTGPGFGFERNEYQYRSFRLETSPHNLTSNRAELRAATVALVETDWKAKEFRGIVIPTDSEYVVRGSTTEYMPSWRNELTVEWKVKRENMGLWDRLITAIEAWQSEEFLVVSYAIRRDLNRADRYAKEAVVSVTSSRTLLVKDLLGGIESLGLGNLGSNVLS